MKKFNLLIAFLLTSIIAFSQASLAEIDSPEGKVKLKIQLPRDYEANADTMYPVVVVLDGDYLFNPIAGVVDYYSYWDEMPDAIVVGIKQLETKENDFLCDDLNGLPDGTGAEFFEFLTLELFNFIDNNYRTAPFRIIAGHGESANFLNFYLFQEKPFFNAYISLSPSFTPKMELRLKDQLEATETDIFYTLATAEDDRKRSKNSIAALHGELKTISNELFHYNYNYYPKKSHYELVSHAIPSAIENIFEKYKPISKREYKEEILGYDEGTAYDYLVKKYETIETLYGIEKQIRLNDFNAAEAAIKKNEDWDALELLGKLAKKEYPETMLGLYYIAQFYENTEEPKKAMKAYQNAFTMEPIGRLTKDDMLHYAEMIKADFGY